MDNVGRQPGRLGKQGFETLWCRETMAKNATNTVYIDNISIFPFERTFDCHSAQKWMQNHWHLGFYYCAIYVAVIFGVQGFMATRKKFELRKALFVWNLLLAIFSITGLIRTLPEIVSDIKIRGFSHSVCSNDHPQYVGFWVFAFVLSKLPELGDTIFIVLRKQKLVFLHWYHHITVLLFCWYSYQEYFAPGRWYMNMNYFVHSMMYTYFALRAIQVKVPRWAAMIITSSQLIQMVMGLLISCWAFYLKFTGKGCHVSELNAKLALLMYSSYFLLFSKLFKDLYLTPSTKAVKNKSI